MESAGKCAECKFWDPLNEQCNICWFIPKKKDGDSLQLIIQGRSDVDYYALLKWMQNVESPRRYDLQATERAAQHVKKIKKFRNGHRLIITHDIYGARNKIAIPAGTIVKLLNTKRQRTRAEIYYEKTDEEWLIDFKYLEDAQDPEILQRVKQNIHTTNRLSEIFRK